LEKVEKGEKTMNSHMNKNVKIWLVIIVTLIAIALLAAFWASYAFPFPPSEFPQRRPPSEYIFGDLEVFYIAQTVLSTVNVALLAFLLTTYIDIYRKTRSQFTLGLIIFSSVFLLRALTANPLFMWVFGFRAFGLGPFALLPDLFEFVALSILLYLSVKY
jgi:disulfide bond formation protein DsbB